MNRNVSFYVVAEGHDPNKHYDNEDDAIKAINDSPKKFGSIYMLVYMLHVTPDGKAHRRMNHSLEGNDQILLHSHYSKDDTQKVKELSKLNETLLAQNEQAMNELWTLKAMVSNLEDLITAVKSLFSIYKHQHGRANAIPGRYEFNRILDILSSDPNKHLKAK